MRPEWRSAARKKRVYALHLLVEGDKRLGQVPAWGQGRGLLWRSAAFGRHKAKVDS